MLKILKKAVLIAGILLVSAKSFAAVTIDGYLYSSDPGPDTRVYFSTPYPDSVKSSPVIPYEELVPIVVNTTNLTPHTTAFTLSDNKGNKCDIGVTSTNVKTQFEIIDTTSAQFCVIAPAPNYMISIMPQEKGKV